MLLRTNKNNAKKWYSLALPLSSSSKRSLKDDSNNNHQHHTNTKDKDKNQAIQFTQQQQQQQKDIEQDVKTLMSELKTNVANEKLRDVILSNKPQQEGMVVDWSTFAKYRGIYQWLKVAEDRRTAVLSKFFTYPMSIVYGMQQLNALESKTITTINIIGARAEVMIPDQAWGDVYHHFFPNRLLRVNFIGPEISKFITFRDKQDVTRFVKHAYYNEKFSDAVTFASSNVDNNKKILYSPKDSVQVLFHPGIGHPDGGWDKENLELILHPETNVLFTSFSDADYERDLRKLREFFDNNTTSNQNHRILEKNPFAYNPYRVVNQTAIPNRSFGVKSEKYEKFQVNLITWGLKKLQ